jgi:hypothetical protein
MLHFPCTYVRSYRFITFIFAVPEITASILPPQGLPVLGNAYILNCAVNNIAGLSASISYSLNRLPSGALTTASTASLPLVIFAAITLADVGTYQCSATVSSPFLTDDIIVLTGLQTITLARESLDEMFRSDHS